MRVLVIAIILFAMFIGSTYLVVNWDLAVPSGWTFCNHQGYDGVDLGGSYSKKFGKVTCVSCYDGECITEEFNVIKNKLGIIKEIGK